MRLEGIAGDLRRLYAGDHLEPTIDPVSEGTSDDGRPTYVGRLSGMKLPVL